VLLADPSISINKEIYDGHSGLMQILHLAFLLEGTTPQFRITVTNTGNVDLTDILIEDVNNTADRRLHHTLASSGAEHIMTPAELSLDGIMTAVGQNLNTATALSPTTGRNIQTIMMPITMDMLQSPVSILKNMFPWMMEILV